MMLATATNSIRLAGSALLGSASQKRRFWRFARFCASALLAKREARAYAHVAWSFLAALAFLMTQTAELGWLILPTLALFGALGLIALFDARYFLIPNKLVLFLSICGGFVILANNASETPIRLASAGCAYAALRALAWTYERFRGEAGLGEGDVKLFAVAGLWLGFEGLPTCLVLAVLSAILSAAISFRDGALLNSRQPIPFGPHLALGFWLVWALGPLERV